MSKIASAGLLSDIDCAQIINAVTKMINFDDAIFQFVQKKLREMAIEEKEKISVIPILPTNEYDETASLRVKQLNVLQATTKSAGEPG